ncbi:MULTISPECIES: Crp/Fnr family transcriptional regulator [unclassified Sedimentibacter]|uniref:Crp/Fnr family transcriptional regulator n=1 Tax=unclassified Sedimentibacter TaxID=2649220 RepID=UPI0027DEF729|nr:Crp/Fnr family transcriptional regulator [Sedimentibacter sp. MB35-C1]WMJ76908.1 Crp/Fnr family transcriptional regulator [Sedimentibacter sp. MB35-C1]
MKKYLKQLQNNELFNNFNLNDLERILNCLSAKVNYYKKKDVIIQQGAQVHYVGIVLSGGIQIIKEDIEGNINIISHLGINDIFAEAFAYADIYECPITVQATENCEIMFIDCKRIIKTCNNACAFHWNMIENMLSMIARKNIMLNQKMEILSKRTTREKLLEFFNTQIQINHSKRFSIPYNREGLAFYLCVDRSALSRELSNMRDEGLLKFNKNEFEIL